MNASPAVLAALIALALVGGPGASSPGAGAEPTHRWEDVARLMADAVAAARMLQHESDWVDFRTLEDPAAELAGRLRGAAEARAGVSLEEFAHSRDPVVAKLSLLGLAKLGSGGGAAPRLADIVAEGDVRALVALSYLPPAEARPFLHDIVRRRGRLRAQTARLLRTFGDGQTLRLFDELSEQAELADELRAALRLERRMLAEMLGVDEATRSRRAHDELAFWRAEHDLPGAASEQQNFAAAARRLKSHGVTLSPEFLLDRFRGGSPFAAAILGEQREARAVPELQRAAVRLDSPVGEAARRALLRMGPVGLRGLEALLRPGSEALNQVLLNALAWEGDGATLDLLSRLESDPAYLPVERELMRSASSNLRQVLADRSPSEPRDPGK